MGLVVAAFAAIYLIWGSTYLGIRIAVETLPPFLLAGFRSLIAGALMFAFAYPRAGERPSRAHWKSAVVIGGLLLLGGNGLVTWSEQTVPSGAASLIITTVPLWMVLLHWMRRDGARPTLAEGIGVVLGFGGVTLLIGAEDLGNGAPLDRWGAAGLLVAALSWALGSLHSRRAHLPRSPLLATAMQMLAGGTLLILAGLLRGEAGAFHWSKVSTASLLAFAYLIVFGSLIGFTAYCWLLRVSTPARVSTYAFVNPMVAVFFGCVLGNEPFSPRLLIASAIIIAAVVVIVAVRTRAPASGVSPSATDTSSTSATAAAVERCDARRILEDPPDGAHHFSLEKIDHLRRRSGRPYLEFLRVDAMSLGLYTLPAGGADLQGPHTEDEAYYVVRGRADFRLAGKVRSVEAGDVLFVPAGMEHRFENIADEITLLVTFAPAECSQTARPTEPIKSFVADCCT